MKRKTLLFLSVTLAVLTFALPAAAQTTLFSESFDGVNAPNLPAGWAVSHVAGSSLNRGWTTQSVMVEPATTAHSAPNVARFNAWNIEPSNAYRLYRTTPARLGCAMTGTVTLSFWMYHDPGFSNAPYDRIQIQYSTDGGTTWNDVAGALFERYADTAAWTQHNVDLSGVALGQTDFRVGFYAISEFGNDMYIDDIRLTASAAVPVLSYAYSQVVDHCASGGPYSGDYIIDPGESVNITPSLTNAGTSAGANFSGTLTTTTPGVTIPTNTVTWPAIPAGSPGTSADSAFVVDVGLGVPCTTLMQFHVAITNGTCSFEDDFTLRVGVHDNIPVFPLMQLFDGVTPPVLPAGWSTVIVGPSPVEGTPPQWFTNGGTHQPPGHPAVSTPNCAYFNSYDTPPGYRARLQSTPIDFSPYVEGVVSFQIYHATTGSGYYTDGVQLQYSTDGTNWTDVGDPVYVYSPVSGWWAHSFFLPPAVDHQPTLYIGLLGWSAGGLDCNIDNIGVMGTNYSPCHPCAPACSIDYCTATGPSLGFAGFPASFTGSVTTTGCTGTPTWSWSFSDGGASTSQNPTHTFAAPGSYTYTMTVTVDGVSCTSSTGSIQICTLTCSASATPTSGMVPLNVNFAANAIISGCALDRQTIGYLWSFGDGATSTNQNPPHTYTAAGTYPWTCTITVDGTPCVQSGVINVSAYDLHFRDDYGTSTLCVNSATGDWVYAVLAGPYKGVYRGRGQVIGLSGEIWLLYNSYPGVKLSYSPSYHHAGAWLWLGSHLQVSSLVDANTLDDPPECPGKPAF